MTTQFREDLVRALGGPEATSSMVVVEIGTYLGYTTRFLAGHFRAVVGVEAFPDFAASARSILADHKNAIIAQLNTLKDDLAPVASFAREAGGANVVVVDGDHAYVTVLNDISLALFGGRPRWVALDDYFNRAEVAQAVADFVDLGLLRISGPLGKDEGMLCEVIG